MKRKAMSFMLGALAIIGACGAFAAEDGPAGPIHEALRVRVNSKPVLGEADLQGRRFPDDAAAMAEFRKNIVPIRQNASVQLSVEAVEMRGRAVNVTTHPSTVYQSLAPSRLSVSHDGLVTTAPTADARAAVGGDLAVLVVYENKSQQGWNKIFFSIQP